MLLAFPIGFALGLYLLLYLAFSVSLYPRFAAIHAGFWVLVLLLLLVGSPARHKLWVLGLLVVALFAARYVDWNSRKPFLRDLYRVKDGMTVAQVDAIMGDYMVGGGVPLDSPGSRLDGRADELSAAGAKPVTGTISYRHTDEGWGDSDWGVVTFEDGRVVDVSFSPD